MWRFSTAVVVIASVALICAARAAGQNEGGFAPLEKWRAAVFSGDANALTSMYSASPPAQVASPDNKLADAQDDVAFWSGWKARGLADVSFEDLQEQNPAPTVRLLIFEAVLSLREGPRTRKIYVAVAQTWTQQSGEWRIEAVKRMAPARLKQPLSAHRDIYPAGADAKTEIAEAIRKAAREHKRILVDFGADWCFDCHVLDEAFRSAEIAPVVMQSFEVVHIDVGEFDKNTDLAEKYGIPLKRGIPAIAVLDSDGKLLFSQKRGEFEAARGMAPEDILEFLNKWKPVAASK